MECIVAADHSYHLVLLRGGSFRQQYDIVGTIHCLPGQQRALLFGDRWERRPAHIGRLHGRRGGPSA